MTTPWLYHVRLSDDNGQTVGYRTFDDVGLAWAFVDIATGEDREVFWSIEREDGPNRRIAIGNN